MDAPSAFSWGTAGYLTLQSSLLLFTPGFVVNMLAADEPRRASDLEIYLSRSLSLTGFAFAAVILLLTGVIPVLSYSNHDDSSRGPYAFATVFVVTWYHAACATYIYMHNFSPVGQASPLGATAGVVISAFLACLGLWVVMFGEDAGRISKSTGADKRTSAYPFENSEAASERKKSLRKGL